MKASTLRRAMNLWPPFLFSGIKITHIAEDYREVAVELHNRRFNMNYVGVHFGGALFSMTDPFFMLMMMNILGRGYVVWDKAGSIEYIKPGKGITDVMVEEVRAFTPNDGDKYLPTWSVDITDNSGDVVARVSKTLYIRRGIDSRKRIGSA
jgi:acyl-coenzyme A thioesterase PaaI-like protein